MLFLYNRVVNNNGKCIVLSPSKEFRSDLKYTLKGMIDDENYPSQKKLLNDEYVIINEKSEKRIHISDGEETVTLTYEEADSLVKII